MKVSENAAWHEWVIFFLRGVEEQAQDAIVRAKRLQDLQIEWKERLSQARASPLVLRLADSLFVSPLITTIPEAQRISGVKQYRTARKGIEKLVSVGILRQLGESSYGKTFVVEEILRSIGEGTKCQELYFFIRKYNSLA